MTAAPVVVIPDTTPLIHLAAGGLLHLLPAMGRVIVPDVVALEATRLPEKPWAPEIAAWFKAAAIEIAGTEIGELCRLALDMGRRPPRNAGEVAIIGWLRDDTAWHGGSALIVYEDPLVPKLVEARTFAAPVATVSTRSFLDLAERRGIIPSAATAWDAIAASAPTASPVRQRSAGRPDS